MLDTVIVGGGVCGLAVARSLKAEGRSFALYEARPRLGGRVLSVPCSRSGLTVDLGPTWFWPQTQPVIAQLVAELGLDHFPQHDEGAVLVLADPDKKPDVIANEGVHGGARRLSNGMAALVDALSAELAVESVHVDHALVSIEDSGDHVVLTLEHDGTILAVTAARAVLAVPPRLLVERIHFTPSLDPTLVEAMRQTPTWMAAKAKLVIACENAAWRDTGYSGNAFVTHEQAVLGEIFDACDDTSTKAALGGFLALPPDLRESFAAGLPMLMGNQVAQVFGPALEHGEQYYKDWATEAFTCSTLDRLSDDRHLEFGNPLLRRPLWGRKLLLGGAETGRYAAGYLEGALDAAQRIKRELDHAMAPKTNAAGLRRTVGVKSDTNAASLATFRGWVASQSERALEAYRHHLNHALAKQETEQLTQRAILGAVEEVYARALTELETLSLDTSGVAVERGRSTLTPDIQAAFHAFLPALVDEVVAFNRTSCALSNFPDEHDLSAEYLQVILKDIAAAWREFSLSANAIVVSKSAGQTPALDLVPAQ